MSYPEEVLDTPDGSAMTWILEHCLRYPGTYEIPLRTMYALNSNPTRCTSPVPRPPGTAVSNRSSGSSNASASSAQNNRPLDAAAGLREQLSHQISRLPSQPCSLPPSFITSFLRRCFCSELDEVDFPQALTALDYLKDLDSRRRKEVSAALQRLGVVSNNAEVVQKHPAVLSWVKSMNAKIRKVEVVYSQIYIDLRRWTLLNEMLLSEPFNKFNCVALLNTLFPPVTAATVAPTAQLTLELLRSVRDGFWRTINAVETNGKQVLERQLTQGAREGDANNWPVVRESLEQYLVLVSEIIDECTGVTGLINSGENEDASHRRKVDSGISFGPAEKPPSSNGGHSAEDLDKPLPLLPSPTGKKGGSTLERLARELRKLGDAGKTKNLKKMKSYASIDTRSEAGSPIPTEVSAFDMDEPKHRRFWASANRRHAYTKQSSWESR